MNAREAIKSSIELANVIGSGYLEDLSDSDLLVRPVPGANHIAWQLGHLIVSSQGMFDAAFPGTMPPLPAGFKEKYASETSASDDSGAFHAKAEYVTLMNAQREAALKKLAALSDADLDRPAPEEYQAYIKTLGDLFAIQGSHLLMHAGQWAIVRRKLGRKPLF